MKNYINRLKLAYLMLIHKIFKSKRNQLKIQMLICKMKPKGVPINIDGVLNLQVKK